MATTTAAEMPLINCFFALMLKILINIANEMHIFMRSLNYTTTKLPFRYGLCSDRMNFSYEFTKIFIGIL